MDGPEAAEAAIAGMTGVDLLGRTLSVQKVRLYQAGQGVFDIMLILLPTFLF